MMEMWSKPLDQAGIDQKTIEPARLPSPRTIEEQSLAAIENASLFCKRRIERKTGGPLHDQRQIGRIEQVKRGTEIDRLEVQPVDGVIGREVARIMRREAPSKFLGIDRRVDDMLGEFRLMITIAHDQERFVREVTPKLCDEFLVVALGHGLATQIFIGFRKRVAGTAPACRREFFMELIVPGKMVCRQKDK